MSEELARSIGRRIRSRRVATRKTQAVAAGLADITTDYLYQIERGKKLPTIPVLARLADVLEVPIGSLVGGPSANVRQRSAPAPRPLAAPSANAGSALARALIGPSASGETSSVQDLCVRVQATWREWQTSARRYSLVGGRVANLVEDFAVAEHALRQAGSADEQRRLQLGLADLYGLLRTVAKRLGRTDLALLAADRAITAAELADDPLRLAAARWNVAHVLLATGQADGAEDVAMHGAAELRRLGGDDLDAAAVTGALLLAGAVASARRGRVWQARDRVREAAPLAELTGERNTLWTAFGPTNVAMHAVSVEVEAGETTEALRIADEIDPALSPSIERRVAFQTEQARSHQRRRDYASALIVLQALSAEAPEDVVHRPAARQILEDIVGQGRRAVAGEAARLATRLGLTIG